MMLVCLIWVMFGTAACLLDNSSPPAGVIDAPPPLVTATLSEIPPLWTDANDVMRGICFESAYDAAGQVFVLRSDAELSHLFDLSDHSQLCRHPVARQTFSFEGGRVLAGVWSIGRGCTAEHHLIEFYRNDPELVIDLRLRLEIAGDCPYDLVRPFWIALDNAARHTISITVE